MAGERKRERERGIQSNAHDWEVQATAQDMRWKKQMTENSTRAIRGPPPQKMGQREPVVAGTVLCPDAWLLEEVEEREWKQKRVEEGEDWTGGRNEALLLGPSVAALVAKHNSPWPSGQWVTWRRRKGRGGTPPRARELEILSILLSSCRRS